MNNEFADPRDIPVITCALSISFLDEVSAKDFAIEVETLTGSIPRTYRPKINDVWIVEAAVIHNERFWHLNEALLKLFDSICTIKNQLNDAIKKHRGTVTMDIAVYETEGYPALYLSNKVVNDICFFSASIGIDLV